MTEAQFVVGLTGGIGSGKTTVSDLFATRQIVVVDADLVAREVVEPGEPLLDTLADTFGTDILHPNGRLNRAALRQLVFSDSSKKEQLNQLMHPAIRARLLSQLEEARSPYVILSAPLLFENQLDTYCLRTLVVDVPESVQIERTMQRDDVDLAQVQAIMQAQWSRQQRLDKATEVIDNSLPIDTLDARVEALHQFYLQLSEQ
ncbi:dephospho-CoA kinase [Aliidiomarina taiwanensis]|uniref:Dephospho-CoA kinase n=1 Tax=Aliidiomarina taiwanensis TaxID=946228 RepID=A0A432X7R5_9GAMM|nr:dephospho-CoA kinase [Aliidiomarina taiwanensis]RUO42898.1 dephospho-CoA kinase [Aliidiomarina taiwanensis]